MAVVILVDIDWTCIAPYTLLVFRALSTSNKINK